MDHMISTGKSIRLFLVDGTPTGLITAEVGQWTGKALVASRQGLDHLAKRDEARRPGVYILIGPDPDKDAWERVYIGEAESVFNRLRSHNAQKDFWTRVCVFTVTDESLTKAHIKYLESRLVEEARNARVVVLENGNTPPRPRLPEADQSDLEVFLSHVRTLLPVIGIHILESVSTPPPGPVPNDRSEPVFAYSPNGAAARAVERNDLFVVLAGSTALQRENMRHSTYRNLQERLLDQGVLAPRESGDGLLFTRDYGFSSPSAAAAIVSSAKANGRTSWKVEGTNTSYCDWQDARLQEAQSDAGMTRRRDD